MSIGFTQSKLPPTVGHPSKEVNSFSLCQNFHQCRTDPHGSQPVLYTKSLYFHASCNGRLTSEFIDCCWRPTTSIDPSLLILWFSISKSYIDHLKHPFLPVLLYSSYPSYIVFYILINDNVEVVLFYIIHVMACSTKWKRPPTEPSIR
jgi:hypothetical protein